MGNPFKKTTTTDSTMDYGYYKNPGWQELEDLKGWKPETDPHIGANYAKQERDFTSSFLNPNGPYTTPEMQQQMMQAGLRDIGQNKAQAFREDQYGQNQQKLGQLSTVAGLAAPKFAQTKGTQKQSGSGGWLTDLAGAAVGGLAAGGYI